MQARTCVVSFSFLIVFVDLAFSYQQFGYCACIISYWPPVFSDQAFCCRVNVWATCCFSQGMARADFAFIDLDVMLHPLTPAHLGWLCLAYNLHDAPSRACAFSN